MIPIIHTDPMFIVVNKPSGVLTISTFGVPSIQTLLREQLKSPEDQSPFVEPPHRLDRGTSGVLLIARNRKALSNLSQQFHHRQTRKKYLIAIDSKPLMDGMLECRREALPEAGTLEDWVRKIPDVAQAEIVSEGTEGAKKAVLHYQTIYRDETGCILEIEMVTGRMHQIRVQFGSRGFPILGDKAYGSLFDWVPTISSPQTRVTTEFLDSTTAVDFNHEQHTALHALHIAFRHPKDASWVIVNASPPDPWKIHFPRFSHSADM